MIERFEQVLLSSQLNGFTKRMNIVRSRHHNDGDLSAALTQFLEHRHSIKHRHVEIEQYPVDLSVTRVKGESSEAALSIVRLCDVEPQRHKLIAEYGTNVQIIVNDQDTTPEGLPAMYRVSTHP